ncbi:MAG TPA: diadenylate cyclase CdaA [Bacilli bacterium]|nr:diadenylate cyclase CdaA [Bacilli bacterium]
MELFDNLRDYFSSYTNNYSVFGVIRLVIDLLFLGIIVFVILNFLFKNAKIWLVLKSFFFLFIIGVISLALDLSIMKEVIKYGIFVLIGVIVITYSPEIKQLTDALVRTKGVKHKINTEEEKEQLINTLITTVEYLSKRHIGAIITIEEENSLNMYIDKAIIIDSQVSFELLTTIFTPGTALHDGAVIIRGNRIMCAAAYFPSTDKFDIPKNLGSRHRAAIGISEICDAFTIVVSEERGKVSTTIDGTINIGVSLDDLRESLNKYVLTQ